MSAVKWLTSRASANLEVTSVEPGVAELSST